MKKHIKRKLTGTILAAALVFSGVTPVAYAETVSVPNKITSNAEIARTIAAEGTVLLKNDYNALPLKRNDAVIGFGAAQDETQVVGGGGSGWVNAVNATNYRVGMETAAKSGAIKSYVGRTAVTLSGAYNKILYFISRSTSEGEDLKENQYYLDETVKSDITSLINGYGKERIIVILNVGTVCDTSWLIEKDVAAIVLAYYGGEQAGSALADILTGAVTPSGKTVDTWAKSYDCYPSSDGSGIGTFAGDRSTYYTEDVYVGYRYFSTFDPEYKKVNYEFGYGLSYTKFRMDNYSCAYKDGVFTVSANVTNIGAYSGKEVLQVYFEAPKGVMGAPAAELAGFAKTELLQPGQSQTLNITFNETEFARYDDIGKISANSWVVEKGNYLIRAGNSVKDAYSRDAVFTHSVSDDKVTETTSALRPTQLNKRLLADGSYEQLGETATLTTVHTVPAAGGIIVQAEDYVDRAGSVASEYFYNGTIEGIGLGGLNLNNNTMVAYDLYVEKAGTYNMAFNFSSAWDAQNDMVGIYVNDVKQDIRVNMNATHTPNDGLWHTYTHLSSPDYKITLPQGNVKLKFVGNGLKFMNFDCFWLYSNNVSPDKSTTVQAETFTNSNGGIAVMPDGATTDTANNGAKFYEYDLNVEKAGKYYLSLKASNITKASNDAFIVMINGTSQSGVKIALPRTAADGNVLESNYMTFTDTAPIAVDLPQGEVRFRLVTRNSSLCRMDSFTLTPESIYTPVPYEYKDNTDDFTFIDDLSGKEFDKVITYDDVYADRSKMDDFVAQMPINELVHLVGLDGQQNDAQTGTGGVGGKFMNSAYRIPSANTSDGPAGIRYVNDRLYSTWFPCMTLLASTWNTELAFSFGQGVALEALLGGVNVWLAPGVNIHRNPLCGRNFEYFSEDPLVAGIFASQVTLAAQSYGVSVCVKHYVANEQETNRFANNTVVSARALREIYLKPFEIAVKTAHPFSIMSSYNKINGLHAASSYDLITDVLRGDWGFDGAVFSDWGASMSHIANVKSGNTFKSSNPHYDELIKAYQSGMITRAELERNAKDAINFLFISNAAGQKMTVIDYEFVNDINIGNVTKTVTGADGKKTAFIKFSITKAGLYRIDTLETVGTVTAHSGDFELEQGKPTYMSVGTHEFAVEYTGDSFGSIAMKKVADPTPVIPDDPNDKPPAPVVKAEPDDSLSGGAIAGIVIGSVAGAAALAGGATVVIKKRKGKKPTDKAIETSDDPPDDEPENKEVDENN